MPQNKPLQKQTDKKLLHKSFLGKNFWHKNYCCKNKSQKIFVVLFLQHHYLHQNLFALQLVVSPIFVHLFLIAKKQHTPKQMCKILRRKKCWCKISCRKNNACKIKSSKIIAYFVRVHNDKGLELCGREGTGEWTFIFQPNERSHKRASTLP